VDKPGIEEFVALSHQYRIADCEPIHRTRVLFRAIISHRAIYPCAPAKRQEERLLLAGFGAGPQRIIRTQDLLS
jgi:hypothetical protein